MAVDRRSVPHDQDAQFVQMFFNVAPGTVLVALYTTLCVRL